MTKKYLLDIRDYSVYENSRGEIVVERRQTQLLFRTEESKRDILAIVEGTDNRTLKAALDCMFDT